MNATLEKYGYPQHPVADYKYLVGDGLVNLVRRVLPADQRDDIILNLIVAAEREEYGRRWANKTRPYEGVPELLDALAEHKTPMCVLSNKPDDFTRLMVKTLLPTWEFAVVRGERKDTPMKPDPTGAKQIASELGIPATEFIYVGDTGTDMQTAVSSGMFPVGVLWGFRNREELVNAGAIMLLDQPCDLLALL
jgi:phosphoglycolate phosphatase